jgi:single-strand DNA-binding protein
VAQGLNRAMLIGHLGRAPEMRYTPDGKPVTSFSIVTVSAWASSNGERHQETDWFNVVAWGELAEECKRHLSKSQQVYVEGRIKTRRWSDTNDVRCSCAEVVAQDVIALDARPDPTEPQPKLPPAGSHC